MPIPTARVTLISTCFLTDSLGAFDASAIDSPLRRHLDVRAESPGYLPYRQTFGAKADTLRRLVIALIPDSTASSQSSRPTQPPRSCVPSRSRDSM
jgi:hypothetical protein